MDLSRVQEIYYCAYDNYLVLMQVLSLSQSTVSQLTIGHVVNLASNDVHRFDYVSSISLDLVYTSITLPATRVNAESIFPI